MCLQNMFSCKCKLIWYSKTMWGAQVPQLFSNVIMVFYLMTNCKNQSSKPPTRYARVSHEEKVKLVKLIHDEGLSIGKAARTLTIKLSTAKLIWARYRLEGTFFQKRSDRKTRLAGLAEEKGSLGMRGTERSVRSNSPQFSLIMGTVVQSAENQVLGHEAATLGSEMNGGSCFYWWGHAYFMDSCLNWCQFY